MSLLEQRLLMSTVTIGASADAYVRDGTYADTNYGNVSNLFVKHNAGGAGFDRESYVRFTLSSLPADMSVGTVKLRLWGHATDSSETITVGGYHTDPAARDWVEGNGLADDNPVNEITWNNAPLMQALLDDETVTYNGGVDQMYEWDVSSYFRTEKSAGAPSVTFGLTAGNATASVLAAFASREFSNTAYRPQLVVTSLDYQQNTGGQISMEAERYTNAFSAGGKSWNAYSGTAGFSGTGAVQAMSNTGASAADPATAIASAPRLDYTAYFARTGVHYVSVRGLAPGGIADDSIHVGLDGQIAPPAGTSSVVNGLPAGTGGYGWKNDNTPTPPGVATMRAAVHVATAGIHTINVWMREDGVVLDKLIVASDAAYAPTGTGAAVTLPAVFPAPTNVASRSTSGTGALVTWDDNGSGSGVAVFKSTDGVNFTPAGGARIHSQGVLVTGLNPNTAYTFQVRPTNAFGGAGAPVSAGSVTTGSTNTRACHEL